MLLCLSQKNTKREKAGVVKQEILKEVGLSEAFDTIDDTGMSNTNIEWFQDNMNESITNREHQKTKQRRRLKKNLDNFTE